MLKTWVIFFVVVGRINLDAANNKLRDRDSHTDDKTDDTNYRDWVEQTFDAILNEYPDNNNKVGADKCDKAYFGSIVKFSFRKRDHFKQKVGTY